MTQIADEVRLMARQMTMQINSCIELGEAQGKVFYLNEDAIAEFLQSIYDKGYQAAEAKYEYS